MGDRADGGEHVLDPVVQLGVDQMLQLVGGLAFLGLNARLNEQRGGVDSGLLERQLEAVVFGREGILEWLVLVDDQLLLLGIEHGFQLQRPGRAFGFLELVAEHPVFFDQ